MKIKAIEFIGIIALVFAVAGVGLNNYKLWPCFVLWIISNMLSAFIHLRTKVWSLLVRDIIFTILAAHGLYLWTK